ncbi:MAG: phage portal protein [Clostridium sp.]|nr:phage portal protein [Clostridium sp.]
MGLNAFLKQNTITPENKKVVISKRFVENNKPIEWEIKAVSEDVNSKIRNSCTKNTVFKGKATNDFDRNRYLQKLCAASVVFPDLKDAELQKSYGVIGEGELLSEMLLPGEFGYLLEIVQEINGYDADRTEEYKEEVKNS